MIPEQPHPYREVVERIRREKWSQRQDSTIDQLSDLIIIADAVGCQDAVTAILRLLERMAPGPPR